MPPPDPRVAARRPRRAEATCSTVSSRDVSSFRSHTCGVTSLDFGYCWGANAFGTVGNGSTSARVTTPTRFTLPEVDDEVL